MENRISYMKTIDEIQVMPLNQYRRVIYKKQIGILILVILLILSFIYDISSGPSQLSLSDIINTILHYDMVDKKIKIIIFTIRLPVSIMAILVGAGLAVSGMEMQTILNNPLASPYTLGISSAASFGAALSLVVGYSLIPDYAQNFVMPIFAFVFSFGSSFLIYLVGKVKKEKSTIILAGIAINFLFTALNSIFTYFVPDEVLRGITNWSHGSIIGATWLEDLIVFVVLVLIVPFLLHEAWKLTSLCMGDNTAKALGIDVEKLRTKILILTSLITAISVCFVGTIAFIGLVAPYIAKKTVGEEQRFYIPASLMIGGILVSVSDILSKIEFGSVSLPLSIITNIIGIPFLLILIFQRKEQ